MLRWLFALAIFGLMQTVLGKRTANAPPQEIAYSKFVALTRSGVVHSAVVDDSTSTLQFVVNRDAYNKQLPKPRERWYQVWRAPAPKGQKSALQLQRDAVCSTRFVGTDASYVKLLMDNKVNFAVKKGTLESAIWRLVASILSTWVPLCLFLLLMRRFLDTSGSKKQPKKTNETPLTTFSDVAGVDVVKAELEEAVACLRTPERFAKLGASMPSGILLTGPPGTGKTLLARAVAGEAGVPFFACSASEFVEMFVGRGAARIRELFAQARKAAPAVVFIDELDAVGGRRGVGINDERDQTLNQLLTELDGFDQRPSVLLLAATNRPEVLDKALLRPGRISRRIVVPLPDFGGRCSILRTHLRGKPIETPAYKTECVTLVAQASPGFSGADLANVVNEAALLAARRQSEHITLTDLLDGVKRTRDGVNAPLAPLSGAVAKVREVTDALRNGNRARATPLI